ncbi:MAG: Nif3-like dinuclear metal center hexameric protein [Bacteroidetes bacterium]|nr:Nif3-like dinuclear metal center hexameric protein [Bacteroidota bacterium]
MAKRLIYACDITSALESWASPDIAESYDNVGLQVGSPNRIVDRVLISLDLTPQVVDEAVDRRVSLILTHHPLLFHAPTRISDDDFIGQLIFRLARENITLYSAHTNLDAAPGGVSKGLADILDLHDVSFLKPNADDNSGMGAVGKLPEPISLQMFLSLVHTKLKTPSLRYAGSLESTIHTVAVCGGSGGNLIPIAIDTNADVYVTGDLSYHRFFDVLGPDGDCRMALVDAGHYETEKHTEQLLCVWLEKRFPSVTFFRTNVLTSPINYHIF